MHSPTPSAHFQCSSRTTPVDSRDKRARCKPKDMATHAHSLHAITRHTASVQSHDNTANAFETHLSGARAIQRGEREGLYSQSLELGLE